MSTPASPGPADSGAVGIPGTAGRMLQVTIAWIEGDSARQQALSVGAPAGLRFGELLASDAVGKVLARLAWKRWHWSVFGSRRDRDERVRDGDRIELLPELRVDPKVARQRRVEHRRRAAQRSKWLPDRRGP